MRQERGAMPYSIDCLILTVKEMQKFHATGPDNAISMALEASVRSRLQGILDILVAVKERRDDENNASNGHDCDGCS